MKKFLFLSIFLFGLGFAHSSFAYGGFNYANGALNSNSFQFWNLDTTALYNPAPDGRVYVGVSSSVGITNFTFDNGRAGYVIYDNASDTVPIAGKGDITSADFTGVSIGSQFPGVFVYGHTYTIITGRSYAVGSPYIYNEVGMSGECYGVSLSACKAVSSMFSWQDFFITDQSWSGYGSADLLYPVSSTVPIPDFNNFVVYLTDLVPGNQYYFSFVGRLATTTDPRIVPNNSATTIDSSFVATVGTESNFQIPKPSDFTPLGSVGVRYTWDVDMYFGVSPHPYFGSLSHDRVRFVIDNTAQQPTSTLAQFAYSTYGSASPSLDCSDYFNDGFFSSSTLGGIVCSTKNLITYGFDSVSNALLVANPQIKQDFLDEWEVTKSSFPIAQVAAFYGVVSSTLSTASSSVSSDLAISFPAMFGAPTTTIVILSDTILEDTGMPADLKDLYFSSMIHLMWLATVVGVVMIPFT